MPVHVGSPRDILVGYQLLIVQESAGITTTIDTNSTALTVDRGIQLSGYSTARITGDANGIITNGKIKVKNVAGGLLDASSTALLLPGGLKLSGKSTGILTHDSTGRLILSGGVKISNVANGVVTANSTAVTLLAGLKLSGKSTGLLSQSATGYLIASVGFKIGSNTLIYENSTGTILKWKSTAKYISRNSTAN